MPDTDFDLLCYRLIRLEHPGVIKPAESGDGGVDALLPKPGGYAHGWQSKHFPGRMRWAECRKSFSDARENYEPEHYTFCFPRNLTKAEQKTFDKHFRGEDAEIPVDYWGGEEIQARLTETPRGRAIAKHFFKDDGEILAEIKRATEAKGSLDTPQDAMARMKPVGEYLAAGDSYFTYAGSVYGDGAETEPPAGAVMSVSESDTAGVTSRIDVVPNDPEAMELYGPKGKLMLPVEAYRRAEEALARGKDFTFEGIEVIWERLPPAFSEEVNQTRRADITIGPVRQPQPAPWDARFTVENGGARAQIDVDLRSVNPPQGWDGVLEGVTAGLTVRLLLRHVGDGGQGELKYQYSLSHDPARKQLEVLRFLDLAAAGGGTVHIADRRQRERQTSFETGTEEDTNRLEALSAFLSWIVEIEEWTGYVLPVGPEQFTQENFEALGQTAAAIKRGGFDVKIDEIEFVAHPDASSDDLDKPGSIVVRRDLTVDLFGKTIPLGPSQIVLEGYKIEQLGLDPEGRQRLRLRPEGDEPTTLMERIGKPKNAKRPPPPPKRRGRKRRGRSRRKRGR